MRSRAWFDEELRRVHVRCSECVVAWGGRPSDYQSEVGDVLFDRLQDQQECEICGRDATRSRRLWAIRKISGSEEDKVGAYVCSEQGVY